MPSLETLTWLINCAANNVPQTTVDPELLKLLSTIASLVGGGGLLGIITLLVTKTLPWLRSKIDSRSIEKRVGAELFTAANIERSIRYFVSPDCQSVDPAGGEEPRLVYAAREPLLQAIDNALTHPTEYRHVFLLADSGMGKTTALLNYYARHIRRRHKKFNLVLIPLGIPDADVRIEKIENKESTVLFLDALDEDTLAIVDHAERLKLLLRLTRNFSRVFITCRTQFFPKDEEIPQETGVIKIGARAAGEPAEYVFHKIYVSPLSDKQVVRYLRKRYPFWRWKHRRTARMMVQKIPNLTARPMLLAHIDALVRTGREIRLSVELYEEMINAWLEREKGTVQRIRKSDTEKEDLRQFSERLAVDMYANRFTRGAERVPKGDLARLAEKWGIALDDWKLSGRSLLNRDATGNYKFAHRSIMEHLFVRRIFQDDPQCWQLDWTDQMSLFVLETLICSPQPHRALKQLGSLRHFNPRRLARAIISIEQHLLTKKTYTAFAAHLINYLIEKILPFNRRLRHETSRRKRFLPRARGDARRSAKTGVIRSLDITLPAMHNRPVPIMFAPNSLSAHLFKRLTQNGSLHIEPQSFVGFSNKDLELFRTLMWLLEKLDRISGNIFPNRRTYEDDYPRGD